MTSRPPAIEIRNLHKSFRQRGGDPVSAVQGIDLTIQRGEVVALLGPNGAGKTTTLDLVLGFATADQGEVRVFGGTPRAAIEDGAVSAVLQTGGLLADLTVQETLKVVASLMPRPLPIDEVLDRAGLTAVARHMVAKCSGGQQQRLKFGLALLADPELLILDEPTAGMDVRARREFWGTMHAEARQGRTIVFATHYLEEADAFANRVVLMSRGRIVADGSTSEIRARATGRTVSARVSADMAQTVQESILAIDGVQDVTMRGGRMSIACHDSDSVAKYLFDRALGYDLEITSANLEEAFITLTADSLDDRKGVSA
ncbi:ABC transporter ATP-binding protein [Hoyosella altamirensis]|uniref:ABC-2 type transport system ATP-binding protein n=1 Tax=Hoyosella altamirensis TaxID=616997 RepID=A0A839RI76_9ACTN|nr:ABC transporter ATP-binding protein [Hoyosella altamirensis]MBB3036345.1 ABC-2 type transport system ATP-binding protein [Hoyosella altamirensis]